MPSEPDPPGLFNPPERSAAGMPASADARDENKTMTRPQRPQRAAGAFGPDIGSFRLHLAAEGKAPRTVQGYTGAVRWFAAGYLLGQAGKTGWEQVDRQDIQQSMVQAAAPLQRRACLGDQQLERAYAHGKALSLEKALELALPKAGPA
jgi:hypothetical protein